MGTEIERKFLLLNDTWRGQVSRSADMTQGYLSRDGNASVRVRLEGNRANLNVKSKTLGIERMEFEYAIPLEEAREMIKSLCGTTVIEKVRHYVELDRHTWEIDEFGGANAGLVVAEIELGAADEDFERPSWLGMEVSSDPRYYNVNLIDHPYRNWSD